MDLYSMYNQFFIIMHLKYFNTFLSQKLVLKLTLQREQVEATACLGVYFDTVFLSSIFTPK